MTQKQRLANTPTVLDQARSPLPVVITGTIPRDDSTLSLVRFLNEQSAAGRIEVFYFADNDNSEPLLTRLSKGVTREVHPVRVPEDLVVSPTITTQDYDDYFADVRAHLRNQGTQAIGIAFPSLTDSFTTSVSCKLTFSYDDTEFYNFNHGKKFSVTVPIVGSVPTIDVTDSLATIGSANVEELYLLKSPEIPNPPYDRSLLRKMIVEQLHAATNKSFDRSYVDSVLNHLTKKLDEPLATIRNSTSLDSCGVPGTQYSHLDSLSEAAIDGIRSALGKDPAIAQAELTATEIIEGAKEAAAKILELANDRGREIERAAGDNADELRDAAIEAAALVPQLPEMLAAPLATLLGEKQDEDNKRRQQQEREDEKVRQREQQLEKTQRVTIKDHCDTVRSSLETLPTYQFGSFSMVFDTVGFRKSRANFLGLVEGVINGDHDHVPSAESLEDEINESNLGYNPLTIEQAVCAIAVSRFIDELKASKSGGKLEDFGDRQYLESEIHEWDLDQEQIDRAVLRAFMTHAQDQTFDDLDREFVRTCDGPLGGAVAQSLSRSLIAHEKDMAFDVLLEVAPDQPGQTDDTDVLIAQIESLVHEGHSYNGSQLQGTLGAALSEIQRKTEEQNVPVTAPSSAQGAIAQPHSAQRMMRSDGTTADVPGR